MPADSTYNPVGTLRLATLYLASVIGKIGMIRKALPQTEADMASAEQAVRLALRSFGTAKATIKGLDVKFTPRNRRPKPTSGQPGSAHPPTTKQLASQAE